MQADESGDVYVNFWPTDFRESIRLCLGSRRSGCAFKCCSSFVWFSSHHDFMGAVGVIVSVSSTDDLWENPLKSLAFLFFHDLKKDSDLTQRLKSTYSMLLQGDVSLKTMYTSESAVEAFGLFDDKLETVVASVSPIYLLSAIRWWSTLCVNLLEMNVLNLC